MVGDKIIVHKKKYLEPLILLIMFSGTWVDIFKMHPFQQVFFNQFAGNDPMMEFEGDYYGTSYRQGLEYVLENDPSEKINISIGNDPGSINRHILSNNDKERIIYSFMPEWNNDPDYFITNFRTGDSRIDVMNLVRAKLEPYNNEYFSIIVNDMKILGVYKKK